MTDLFEAIRERVERDEAVVVATVVQGEDSVGARMLVYPDGSTRGSLGIAVPDPRVAGDAIEQLARGISKSVEYGPNGDTMVFLDVYPSPNRLLIFGGVHIAVPLVELAKVIGFQVVVIDARGRFASAERFPKADEVALDYADEFLSRTKLGPSDYVVVLTHDPKLDDPALIHALRTNVRYVGAIGSRRTHATRLERLREAGLTDDQVGRICAPVGMDIDAQNPEEIALAIMAEVIAAKNGKLDRAPKAARTGAPTPA